MRLFRELQRRGVLKVAIGYLGVSWLTLEIGHTLFLIFELPHAGLQAIFALLVLGFPLAVFATWQGWLGDALAQGAGAGTAGSAIAPEHAAHGQAAGHHEGHESAWHAAVFGLLVVLVIAIAIGIRFFGMEGGHGGSEHAAAAHGATAPPEAPAVAVAAAFTPPPHSVAVLPFVNMSGDPGQDYFSDGLSEELLNSLTSVRDLQVAARTSSFSFRGKDLDIAEIAHRLNVGAILEGSVRRDGTRIRVTAQLINAVSGFHLWSQTYDRDLRNVLVLQTEIATSVTRALQASLLADTAELMEVGGTSNPQAFDAFLRGAGVSGDDRSSHLARISAFEEAVRIDPGYAKAHAALARAVGQFAGSYSSVADARIERARALAAAQRAVQLAPELAEAHLALAATLDSSMLEFRKAMPEYERALTLGPGSAKVLGNSAEFLSRMGHSEAALLNARQAVALDPVNAHSYGNLGRVLYFNRRYPEAIAAFNRALSLDAHARWATAFRGFSYLGLGQVAAAIDSCRVPPVSWVSQLCLTVAFHKMGDLVSSKKNFDELMANQGDALAYQFTAIYAQWGNTNAALDWLETAYRNHDPGLAWLRVDAFVDPLRQDARFKAIEKKLNFPD